MNAGSLDFSLNLNGQEFIRNANLATNATRQLTNSTRMAAVNLQDMGKTLTASMSSIAYTATLFAGPQVQQVVMPLMLVGKEMKNVATVAKTLGKAAGFGVAGIGVAAAGAVTWLAMLTKGFEALKAEMDFKQSTESLAEQFTFLRDKLLPMIDTAVKRGKLTEAEGIGLKNKFTNASNQETQQEAIKAAQKRMSVVVAEDLRFIAGEGLDKMLREQRNALLSPQKREEETFLQAQDDKFEAALKQAGAAGVNEKVVQEVFNAANKAGLAEIAARFAPGADKDPSRGPKTDFTDLEKMGGILNGLGRGFGNDDIRRTADNTAETNKLLAETNAILLENTQLPMTNS
jgi:polyhydroxyalkanoate synthesis regulator phasin